MTSGPPPHETLPHEAMDAIRSGGLVPLYSSPDPDILYRAAQATVEAGIPVMEVTLRAPGVIDALAQLIARVEADSLPLMVGVGTVLDDGEAKAAIGSGARFIFSPVVSPEVAERCRAEGVAWIPGCATPTEIHTAMELGCSSVKLFPADAIGGPGFLRSVRSVIPTVEAIPSGGVVPEADALEAWFRAGAVAVAVGSWLFPGGAIIGDDWSDVRRRLASAESAVALARERLSA